MTKEDKSIPIEPQTLLALMLVVALFGPASIVIQPAVRPFSNWIIIAMLWITHFSQLEMRSIIVDPFVFVHNGLLLTFRIPFAYQIYRYYKGRTTRERTLIVGIVSEIQHTLTWIVIDFISFLGFPGFLRGAGFPTAYPIPILLILGYYFLKYPIERIQDITKPWKSEQ